MNLHSAPHPNEYFAEKSKTRRDCILYRASTDVKKGEWVKKLQELTLQPVASVDMASLARLKKLRDREGKKANESVALAEEFDWLLE